MSYRGYLKGRKDLIAEIADVVDSMKIAPIREDSQESLRKTQINSHVKATTYIQQ